MCNKHNSINQRVRKQILIDASIVRRYEYIAEHIIKNVLNNTKGSFENKKYNKILVITP